LKSNDTTSNDLDGDKEDVQFDKLVSKFGKMPVQLLATPGILFKKRSFNALWQNDGCPPTAILLASPTTNFLTRRWICALKNGPTVDLAEIKE
jgi:hypothetical protein